LFRAALQETVACDDGDHHPGLRGERGNAANARRPGAESADDVESPIS
jgi:hypothetical protein